MPEVTQKDEILKLMKSKSPVAIFFYAAWCGHCQSMEKAWDLLTSVKTYKVESENIPSELGISGYPHFVLVKDGKVVKTVDGEQGDSSNTDQERADLLKKALLVGGKRRMHSRRRLNTRRLRGRSIRKSRK